LNKFFLSYFLLSGIEIILTVTISRRSARSLRWPRGTQHRRSFSGVWACMMRGGLFDWATKLSTLLNRIVDVELPLRKLFFSSFQAFNPRYSDCGRLILLFLVSQAWAILRQPHCHAMNVTPWQDCSSCQLVCKFLFLLHYFGVTYRRDYGGIKIHANHQLSLKQ